MDYVIRAEDEFYIAINDFERITELLAGTVYAMAKLANRNDVADMIENIVLRYVEKKKKLDCWGCEQYVGKDYQECNKACEENWKREVEKEMKAILGVRRA